MKPYALIALPLTIIVICGWQDPKEHPQQNVQKLPTKQTDTVPKSKQEDQDDFNTKELDKAMKELNEHMKELDIQLKDLDVNIDKTIEESLAKVDFDQIGKQVEQSLKNINWNEIQMNVDNSIKQAQEHMKEINFDKINDEMKELQEKFQSEEFKKQFDSDKLQKQIDEAMDKANEGMQKAKNELQQFKEFTSELEKDGLIDKRKGYEIEWKNGNLYINGVQQSQQVTNKYKKYYREDGKIKMNADSPESF
jgi:CBS-domain-containing membrane protein